MAHRSTLIRFIVGGVLAVTAVLAPVTSATAAVVNETAGSVAHTWTNPQNAGGYEGPTVAKYQTIAIECALQGFRVANGNTWWYKIAAAPWNGTYYVSADAFYNNGATSGSLQGTPYVDPAVPACGSTPTPVPPAPTPSIWLAQGPAAPSGYRYAVTLRGFPANTAVAVRCYDSVSTGGFYTFSLTTDGSGNAFTQTQCYSADGPDHWVVGNGVESTHVQWGAGGAGTIPTPPTTAPSPQPAPAAGVTPGVSPSVVTPCVFALKWNSLRLSASYLGAHRYYGNAYAAVQAWNRAGAKISLSKGDKDANIKFLDFNTNVGLLQDVYAKAVVPEGWLNRNDPFVAYIGAPPPPLVIHSPQHLSVFVNQDRIDAKKLTDANITAIFVHELGHILGLGHSNSCAGDMPSLMSKYAMVKPRDALSKLQPYDIAEFRQWYNLS